MTRTSARAERRNATVEELPIVFHHHHARRFQDMPSWFIRRPPPVAAASLPTASSASLRPPPPSPSPSETADTAQSRETAALEKYLFGDTLAMMEEPAPSGVGLATAPHEYERPSILEFRSSRFTRVNPQRAQMLAAMAHAANAYTMPLKQQSTTPYNNSDDSCGSDDEFMLSLRSSHDRYSSSNRDTLAKSTLGTNRSTTSSTRTTEKTNAGDDDDDVDGDNDNQQRHTDSNDDDDAEDSEAYDAFDASDADVSADEFEFEVEYDNDSDRLPMMALPTAYDVPLLEALSGDNDVLDVDTIVLSTGSPVRALPRTMVVDEHGFQLSRESVLVTAARVRLDQHAPLKTGLLFKQGFSLLRGKGSSSGGWKVRHVELSGSKLAFFREEHGRRRGEIDLTQCAPTAIEIMPRDSVYDGAHATVWRFAVRGRGGRRVLLAAYSEAEMKDWLRALHVALAVQSGASMGRFTDLGNVPTGTFLADRSDGLLRASANFR